MEVDAFLADSVVAAEGKLYVQGAGWNMVQTASLPTRHSRIGIGVIIRVPYTATNQLHKLEIRFEDSDGNKMPLGEAGPESEGDKIYAIGGEFNVGRPPVLLPGEDQIVPIAINVDGLVFDKPDSYSFLISIDGVVIKRLPMRVMQLPQTGPLGR